MKSGLRNERCSPPWRRNLASSLLVGCSKVPTRQRVGLSHWIALGLSDCAAKLRSRGRNRASCVWTSGLSSQQESQNPVGLNSGERKERAVCSALEFVVSSATLTEEQRAPGSGHATTSFSRGSPQTATLARGNRLARRPFRQVWRNGGKRQKSAWFRTGSFEVAPQSARLRVASGREVGRIKRAGDS